MAFDIVSVSTEGPIFDGSAIAAVRSFVDESEPTLSSQGARDVRARLKTVLRNPTGYYESRITHDRDTVSDGNVIYGPWLEGVGERNRTTRFKGYATFRLVAQALEQKAERVLQPQIRRMLGRMQ